MSTAGGRELIGADDVTTPYWARVDESVIAAGTGRMLRAVPRVLAATVGRPGRAAPGLTAPGRCSWSPVR